ncbi:MAG: NAD(P)-binding domain-containing protein [Rhodospirillales bacterium]|nr:NAD(P)-binding domain-containing protein [Rhodospirillales bacterium]
MPDARVAVISLGNMGRALAARLLDTGFAVTVWDRSPERLTRWQPVARMSRSKAEPSTTRSAQHSKPGAAARGRSWPRAGPDVSTPESLDALMARAEELGHGGHDLAGWIDTIRPCDRD